MKRTPWGFGVALLLIGLHLTPSVDAAGSGKPVIRIVNVTVTPRTVSRHGVLTFTVHVQGFHLSGRHLAKPSVAGEGHLQYYLDCIPPDAYRHSDFQHAYISAVTTSIYRVAVQVIPHPITVGTHHIFVALAQNNFVLYRIPPKSVVVTIR